MGSLLRELSTSYYCNWLAKYSLTGKLFCWRRYSHTIKTGFKNYVITIWVSFVLLRTGTRRYCGDGTKLFGQLFASWKNSPERACTVFNHPIHTNSTKKKNTQVTTLQWLIGVKRFTFPMDKTVKSKIAAGNCRTLHVLNNTNQQRSHFLSLCSMINTQPAWNLGDNSTLQSNNKKLSAL